LLITSIIVLFNSQPEISRKALAALVGQPIAEGTLFWIQRLTQDAFLLLILSVYFTIFTPADTRLDAVLASLRSVESKLANLQRDAIEREALAVVTSDPQKTMLDLLNRRYGVLGHRLDNLADIVLPMAKSIWDNVDVSVRLYDSDSTDRMWFESTTVWDANQPEFVMACVGTVELATAIEASCPNIDSIITLSDPKDVPELIASRESIAVQLGTQDFGSPIMQWKGQDIVELVGADQHSYIASVEHLVGTLGPVRVFKASVPPDVRRLSVRRRVQGNKSDMYWTWTASRPMFLNSISLDVGGLTLAEERAGVLFQPFMQNFVDRDVDSKVQNNQRDVKVSNWVVKGQGFAVSWRPVRGSSAATEESPIDRSPPGVPESTADLGSE
jgi:hypothetical protein